MAKVPTNTVSGPQKVRLPGVRMAVPNMAEGMGAVARAVGNTARAFGRSSAIVGQGIDDTNRHFNRMKSLEAQKSRSESEAWGHIERLGSQAISTAGQLDRIQKRKDEEQGRNAATPFMAEADRLLFGYIDPQTGERIPGTYDTPYSPGDGENDANGPSVATAKALNKLRNADDKPWSNLGPGARQAFEEQISRQEVGYLRKAYLEDGNKLHFYRQTKQQEREATLMDHLTRMGEGTNQGDTANWLDITIKGITDIAISEIGAQHFDEKKGEWLNQDAQDYFEKRRAMLLPQALTGRIDNWLAKAELTRNVEQREALYNYAMSFAQMPDGKGGTVLDDRAMKHKLEDITESRDRALKMAEAERQQAEKTATDIEYRMFTGEISARQAEKELSSTPGMTQAIRDKAFVSVREAQDQTSAAKYEYLRANDPKEASKYFATMTESARAAVAKRSNSGNGSRSRHAVEQANMVATMGGTVVPVMKDGKHVMNEDGTPRYEYKRRDRGTATWDQIDRIRRGEIGWDEFDRNMKEIREMTPEKQAVIDEYIRSVQKLTGQRIVENAVQLQDDGTYFVEGNLKSGFGKNLTYEHATMRDGQRRDDAEVVLDAKAFEAGLQHIVQYQLSDLLPDRNKAGGRRLSVDEMVTQMFTPTGTDGIDVPIEVTKRNQYATDKYTRQQAAELDRMIANYAIQVQEAYNSQNVQGAE